MHMRNRVGMIGGAIVGTGIGAVILMGASHQAPTAVPKTIPHRHHTVAKAKKAKPSTVTPAPKVTVSSTTTPAIPNTGTNSASGASASLAALTQKQGVATPTGPIEVVDNLAQPSQKWAFATEAAKGQSTGYTLWFGEQNTPAGPWTWIPSTLPGALSHQLPPAVYSALQWAYDVHVGQPGPTLFGTVSWNDIKGLTGEPVGWTAQESNGTLTLTVWEPSFYGSFHGLYGIESEWYPSTITAGKSGLSMIVANPGPMSAVVSAP